jgi:hypothetical protein
MDDSRARLVGAVVLGGLMEEDTRRTRLARMARSVARGGPPIALAVAVVD